MASHLGLYKAHGFFAFVAWGILAPIAIGAPLLRRSFIAVHWPPNFWFRIHLSLNLTVFVFSAVSFAFATRAVALLAHHDHFTGVKHRTTGLIIMIMVFGQTLSGLLRPPHHPNTVIDTDRQEQDNGPEEPTPPRKSRSRVLWERCHRLHGLALLFFAWWQVQYGLKLYSQYFAAKDFRHVFWGLTGGISSIILILVLLRFVGV
jgi:hypothetical protein